MSRSLEEIIEEAEERGKDAGRSAASHFWDFGRMRDRDFNRLRLQWQADPNEVIQRAQDNDGEPGWLSGEWAGESITELLGDLIEEADDVDAEDDILNAYADAASDEYWSEVWREAEAQFGGGGDDEDDDENDDDEEW